MPTLPVYPTPEVAGSEAKSPAAVARITARPHGGKTRPECSAFRVGIDVDGATLAATLRPPERQDPECGLKAAVLVHGFCGDQTENGLFTSLGSALAGIGLTVITYDCRGLGQSTGNFAEVTIPDHVQDFLEVASYVQAELGIRPAEIVAVGFSLGAAIIGLATREGFSPGAITYLSPATRPALSMWHRYNTEAVWQEISRRGFYTKPENTVAIGRPVLESLRDTDLGPHWHELSLPLLVIHGTEDSRIPIDHTRHALSGHDQRYVRFIEIEGASHSFRPAGRFHHDLGERVCHWLQRLEPIPEGLQSRVRTR